MKLIPKLRYAKKSDARGMMRTYFESLKKARTAPPESVMLTMEDAVLADIECDFDEKEKGQCNLVVAVGENNEIVGFVKYKKLSDDEIFVDKLYAGSDSYRAGPYLMSHVAMYATYNAAALVSLDAVKGAEHVYGKMGFVSVPSYTKESMLNTQPMQLDLNKPTYLLPQKPSV